LVSLENNSAIKKPFADRVMRLAGEIGVRLIKNGAEIYRVEESLTIVISAYGMQNVKIFALPSLIIIRFECFGAVHSDQFRLKGGSVNLDKLERLNALCRRINEGDYSIDEAEKTLDDIINRKKYPLSITHLAYGFVGFFYTLFWGGKLIDAVVAFLCALIIRTVVLFSEKLKTNLLFSNISAGLFLGFFPFIVRLIYPVVDMDKIIIGVIMLLVPGIAIANVMRDVIVGDTYSALLRFTQILTIGVGLAIGVAIPLALLGGAL